MIGLPIQYNMKYYTLNGYLDKFINAKFIDRKQKQKILDSKFIKNIRDIILGDEKKIISCRQIWFLINILTIMQIVCSKKACMFS